MPHSVTISGCFFISPSTSRSFCSVYSIDDPSGVRRPIRKRPSSCCGASSLGTAEKKYWLDATTTAVTPSTSQRWRIERSSIDR